MVCYRNMQQDMVISELQQHGCLVIFQWDCVLPHIACGALSLLRRHFTEDRIIIRPFFTRWLPISHDLTVCGFWLWGYLKDKFCGGNIGNLTDLKNQILLHARNYGSDQLHGATNHVINRCYMLILKQSEHIENHNANVLIFSVL